MSSELGYNQWNRAAVQQMGCMQMIGPLTAQHKVLQVPLQGALSNSAGHMINLHTALCLTYRSNVDKELANFWKGRQRRWKQKSSTRGILLLIRWQREFGHETKKEQKKCGRERTWFVLGQAVLIRVQNWLRFVSWVGNWHGCASPDWALCISLQQCQPHL